MPCQSRPVSGPHPERCGVQGVELPTARLRPSDALARLGGGKFDAGTQTYHEAPRTADCAFQEAKVAGGDRARVHESPPGTNVHPAFPNTPLTQRVSRTAPSR